MARTQAKHTIGSDKAALYLGPAERRFLAGMGGAALLAGARLLVLKEGLVERWQILDEMRHLHLDAVNEIAAFEAVPLESILLVGGA